MGIKVKYFGSIRDATKKNEEEVELSSDSNVREFLKTLCSMYGEPFEKEVFQEGKENLRDDLMITVNETLAEHKKIMGIAIGQGDTIMLLPIFVGGG